MIAVYKILTDKYDNSVNLHLEREKDSITRGHSLKLVHPRCHYDLRKYSFTVRIVNLWNSLPENVISANTVNTFKNRLDKFWSDQELVYDYKAETEVWLVWLILLHYNYVHVFVICSPVLGTTHDISLSVLMATFQVNLG